MPLAMLTMIICDLTLEKLAAGLFGGA